MAAKKMPGENQSLRSVADQCVDHAVCIVWARRHKSRKKKGRKSTPRSHQQFLRGPFRQQVERILLEALIEAKHEAGVEGSAADATPEQRKTIYSRAKWILFDRYHQENPRRGRKPKGGTGLIATKIQRPAHRPRSMSVKDEKAWIYELYGVALGLWAREELISHSSFEEAIDQLLKSDSDNWLGILHRLIPKAVLHPAMSESNPPAKTTKALKERARLARETFSPPQTLLEAERKILSPSSRPKVGGK